MYNEYYVEEGIAYIKLRNRKGIERIALVDASDLNKISATGGWMLHIQNTKFNIQNPDKAKYYARHSTTRVLMHNLLINAKGVDHINGDTLDNRGNNLRVVSSGTNSRNRTKVSTKNQSGIPGVYWCTRDKRWMVYITVNYKTKYIGRFKTAKEAAKARRFAEELHYDRST